ncbi:MAG TPA: glucose-1-phosphate cytidylyltransferase [Phycisphaerae bacterium]|nr:glucose-1-phosphate cytidylyltransferase [Phycisphaerae bacterium]
MKVVILAGGRGTRLGPLTDERPKPMLEVGGRPLLWHIMRSYAQFGFREFTIALGYRGQIIKDYFLNYRAETGDVTVALATGQARFHRPVAEDWTLHLVDTGDDSQTGGRLKRLVPWLDATFFMTYGDGLADVDIAALLRFHRQHGRLATVTAVRPPARFGHLSIDGTQAVGFNEKPQVAEGWINGGYFVLEPAALELIGDDQTAWEIEPLQALARRGQLGVFCHEGFWQCVDTPRELAYLESRWQSGRAPWLPAASHFERDTSPGAAPAATAAQPLIGAPA